MKKSFILLFLLIPLFFTGCDLTTSNSAYYYVGDYYECYAYNETSQTLQFYNSEYPDTVYTIKPGECFSFKKYKNSEVLLLNAPDSIKIELVNLACNFYEVN